MHTLQKKKKTAGLMETLYCLERLDAQIKLKCDEYVRKGWKSAELMFIFISLHEINQQKTSKKTPTIFCGVCKNVSTN